MLTELALTAGTAGWAGLATTAAGVYRRRLHTDPLTGLGNRAALYTRARRARRGLLGLVMIDLDAFKAINDTHGPCSTPAARPALGKPHRPIEPPSHRGTCPHQPRAGPAPPHRHQHTRRLLMPPASPLLDAALWAADRGWPLFPLVPRGSFPALHSRDDCPRTGACANQHQGWEQRATVDPGIIHGCWDHDAYNVGLATGPAGLLVIDLDMPKPGKPVPDRWAQQGAACGMDVVLLVCADAGQPPPLETFTVETPSGGTHLYFTAPTDVELRNTAGERGHGLGWGIDTRAHGGYVVAPGSVRRDGTYRITNRQPPAPLPDWLAQRLAPAPLPPQQSTAVTPIPGRRSGFLRAALDGEVRRVTTAEGGDRNFALYCAAKALGELVAGGALTDTEVTDLLLDAAQAHVAAGAYRWAQAHQTIASGLRAGAKRPRKVAA